MLFINWFLNDFAPICFAIALTGFCLPAPLLLYIEMIEIIEWRIEAKSWKKFFSWMKGSYTDYKNCGYGHSPALDFLAIVASLSVIVTALAAIVKGILYHHVLLIALVACIALLVVLLNIKKRLERK